MLASVLFFLVATLVPAQQPDVSASEKSATQQDVSNRSTEQENPIDKRDALNLNATKTLIAIVGGILGAIAFFLEALRRIRQLPTNRLGPVR